LMLSETLALHGASDAIVSRCRDVERLDRQCGVLRNMAETLECRPKAVSAELEHCHAQVLEAMLDLAALVELAEMPDLSCAIERVAAMRREQGPW
jgi:hypothetical protein